MDTESTLEEVTAKSILEGIIEESKFNLDECVKFLTNDSAPKALIDSVSASASISIAAMTYALERLETDKEFREKMELLVQPIKDLGNE